MLVGGAVTAKVGTAGVTHLVKRPGDSGKGKGNPGTGQGVKAKSQEIFKV